MGAFEKRGKIDKKSVVRHHLRFVIENLGCDNRDLVVNAHLVKGKVFLFFETGCFDQNTEEAFVEAVRHKHHSKNGWYHHKSWEPDYYREYMKAVKKARKYAEKLLLDDPY